jgi:DNA-binding response OmpR family regulator
MNELIAIVDDEPDIVELVSLHLKKNRYRVKEFLDAESFYRSLGSETPDLIVLDLMLPDADGFEICKYLKAQPRLASTPVIMLTARAEETDKILGLELGADDYVTKPFSPKELVARVKAVLRRGDGQKPEADRIEAGPIALDLQKFEVTVEGKRADLTSTEFRILQLLVSKQGWVFSRDKILDHLWGNEKIVIDRTVDVHIKHLREKLGEAGKLIKNVRGIGYKLEA